MNFEVIVQLKNEVLDPEGRAIHETLKNLGKNEIKSVLVSKRYILDIEAPAKIAEELAESISKDFLANPVSEIYQVRKL